MLEPAIQWRTTRPLNDRLLMESPKEILARHEGVKLLPYVDTVGKITIGIGRNLTDRGISTPEAYILFENDYEIAKMEVAKKLPWTVQIPPDCREVLINMCFNMGITRLMKFINFLDSLRVGAYEAASKEMLNSLWAKQVGNRAIELSNIILSHKE
jgi:lysozyme